MNKRSIRPTVVQQLECDTLIVAAGKEAIGNASSYVEMQSRIAGSKLVQYDTAAHNICDGYPERCVNDLLRFLGLVRDESRASGDATG